MALVEASLEGKIQSNSVRAINAGVEFKAMGVTIQWEPGNTIDPYPEPPPDGPKQPRAKRLETPQSKLSVAQFLDVTPLPGRTNRGFEGGTVIADGWYDTDAKVLKAEFVTVEPAETVLLGALTKNTAGPGQRILEVNGVPVVILTDPRLASNPGTPAIPVYHNQYGFPMKIESAPLSPTGPNPPAAPGPTTVEGYFDEAGANLFHAFVFESGDTGVLLDNPVTTPQIVIERAQYRDRGAQVEYELRGFVTTAHQVPPAPGGQSVQLFRVDGNGAGGEVETPLDPALLPGMRITTVEPGFERWRFVGRGAKQGGLQAGVPIRFIARNLSGVPAKDEKEPDRVVE